MTQAGSDLASHPQAHGHLLLALSTACLPLPRHAGTALRSPCLEVLTALTGLTCLRLGGTEVTDEDLSSHLTSLQLLEVLDAWGSRAGNRTVAALAQLPRLRQLVLAWTHVGARLPLLGPGLHALELSQCALAGDWTDADAAVGMALRELVLHQAVLAPLAVELLEIALRCGLTCSCQGAQTAVCVHM